MSKEVHGVFRARVTPMLGLLMAGIVTVSLTACGSSGAKDSSSGSGDGNSKSTEVLRVGYTTGGSAIKFFVAQEEGFFKEKGLDIKPIGFAGGVQAAAAMKGDSVDINLTAATGVATALSAGVDAKTFYADYDESRGDWLVASPGKNINSVQDVAGKTVATYRGTTPWVCLQATLKAEGLTDKINFKDVQPSGWGPAMSKGDVDAVFAFPPQAQKLVAAGGKEVTDCNKHVGETVVWIASASVLQQKKDAITKWLAAMDEASTWVGTHKSEAIKIWAKYSGVSEEDAAAAFPYLDFIPMSALVDPSSPYSMVSAGSGLGNEFKQYRDILDAGHIFPGDLPDLTATVDPQYVKDYLASSSSK